MKTFYQCDPELFLSCRKTLCQKECTLTTFKKYAKRDEFGRAIGVCVDGYIDKRWETFNDWKEDDDSCYHVTAWMPLPEGYKAESEKEE